MFRPHIAIKDGMIESLEMPENTFYWDEDAQLVLFVGKEPNLLWRTFGDSIFQLAHDLGIVRILFVGSFGGTVSSSATACGGMVGSSSGDSSLAGGRVGGSTSAADFIRS